ncbi:MAG TPA: helix-turn-helix transcriptional regulator [Candidatus Kapabacteria bacterium]|nr:helix-turn-helix transcriptional regulator [Candidatus Kapabacteria bacterium]
MDILKVVGKNIRILRQSHGYSQTDLATLAGLRRSYMGHIERGDRNVTLTTLNRIAGALKVHPSTLLLPKVFEYEP